VVVQRPGEIAQSGCSSWRATLSFSFLAFIGYLLSAILVSPSYRSNVQARQPSILSDTETHLGSIRRRQVQEEGQEPDWNCCVRCFVSLCYVKGKPCWEAWLTIGHEK
jgi:hypothetical protein